MDRVPTNVQYCFGTWRPSHCSVKPRSRSPSPPASTTDHTRSRSRPDSPISVRSSRSMAASLSIRVEDTGGFHDAAATNSCPSGVARPVSQYRGGAQGTAPAAKPLHRRETSWTPSPDDVASYPRHRWSETTYVIVGYAEGAADATDRGLSLCSVHGSLLLCRIRAHCQMVRSAQTKRSTLSWQHSRHLISLQKLVQEPYSICPGPPFSENDEILRALDDMWMARLSAHRSLGLAFSEVGAFLLGRRCELLVLGGRLLQVGRVAGRCERFFQHRV